MVKPIIKKMKSYIFKIIALPINIHNSFKKGSLSPGLGAVKKQGSCRFRAALCCTAKLISSSFQQREPKKNPVLESGRQIHPQQ